uniref:YCII-related domain-containing protein n=1 Tax=Knufia peltigerae TaxID=1002370 RepID=A0AA38XRX3_9EURO|nr:hypothetical protein H2204_012707 [Knufia peltigerae]
MPVWYVIEGYDGQDVLAQRLQARPEHLARLTALRDEGRLLLAGPCPAIDSEDPGPAGFSGSVVIAGFDSLPQAQAWADADPYVAAGVYVRVQIRDALQQALAPSVLEIEDDSHRHAGHAGARDGRGHFNVHVVSERFAGMAPLARHRAVYAALGTLMETDIHALSIRAHTPSEQG